MTELQFEAFALWWFLVLLGCAGIPIVIGGIIAQFLTMQLMMRMLNIPPAPPPPLFLLK